MPILILDTGRQVDRVLIMHAPFIFQLRVQHGLVVGAIPLENDIGRILGEVLSTPSEFTCGASLVLASLKAFSAERLDVDVDADVSRFGGGLLAPPPLPPSGLLLIWKCMCKGPVMTSGERTLSRAQDVIQVEL